MLCPFLVRVGLWNCLIYFRPRVIKYLRNPEEEIRKQRRVRALKNAIKQCKGKQQQQQQQRQSLPQSSQPDRHRLDSTMIHHDIEQVEGTGWTDSTVNASSASLLIISSSTTMGTDKRISKNVVAIKVKEGRASSYVEDSDIDYKDFQITAADGDENNIEEILPDV